MINYIGWLLNIGSASHFQGLSMHPFGYSILDFLYLAMFNMLCLIYNFFCSWGILVCSVLILCLCIWYWCNTGKTKVEKGSILFAHILARILSVVGIFSFLNVWENSLPNHLDLDHLCYNVRQMFEKCTYYVSVVFGKVLMHFLKFCSIFITSAAIFGLG